MKYVMKHRKKREVAHNWKKEVKEKDYEKKAK
jgi:hypothetical protein